MSLRELYQEIIVDHGKNPRNVGLLPDATHQHVGNNPLCGDKLVLYVNENAGELTDIKFKAIGCAISVASASLMSDVIKGKSRSEVELLFQQFHQLVTESDAPNHKLGKLAALAGVSEFPVRVKCATLAWHTLMAALKNDPNPVSTE